MLLGDYCYIKLQMLWSWFQISQVRHIKFCASDMSLWFILVEAIHQLLKHKSADPFRWEAINSRKHNCSKQPRRVGASAKRCSAPRRHPAITQWRLWRNLVCPRRHRSLAGSPLAASHRALTNYDKLAPHLITSEGKSQWCLLGVAS